MQILPTGRAGVFTDGSWLYTQNLVSGRAVYGETLLVHEGVEYRRWDADRSKLSAYIKRGGRSWPFSDATRVLYLGAASGTTVSHLSDICRRGTIAAVEVSPRSFRDLVSLAEARPNLLPILADASRPEAYRDRVGPVDVVYQDVAQRDQASIFLSNLDGLRSDGLGFLVVKARSANVAATPADVFRSARKVLVAAGLDVLEVVALDPYAVDHASLVVRKP